jgi:sulfite exporter TauE/SafE
VIEAIGPILVASLLGSPHCAGMCGGFVAFYTGQSTDGPTWPAHFAYNAGRFLSYVTLGAIAGALGAGINQIGAAAGIARAAAIGAGLLMVGWGIATLLISRGVRVPLVSGRLLGRVSQHLIGRLGGHPPAARALLLGLFTTLLPCGWLYAFVATAAGTGSVAGGSLAMAAFWLGTVPMMAGLGLAGQRIFGPLRRHLPAITAAALVIIGLLMVTGRMNRMPQAMERTTPIESHEHGGR